MSKNINRALANLFPENGEGVSDVKFFPGFASAKSPEDFAQEVVKADAQVRSQTAKQENATDCDWL